MSYEGNFFGAMPAIFTIIFLLTFVFIIFGFINAGVHVAKNARSPLITVNAKVIAKRIEVSHHHNTDADGVGHDSSTTYYYVTFETEHGERLELSLSGRVYGLTVEGDEGKLTYQGTWFKDFQRNNFL